MCDSHRKRNALSDAQSALAAEPSVGYDTQPDANWERIWGAEKLNAPSDLPYHVERYRTLSALRPSL